MTVDAMPGTVMYRCISMQMSMNGSVSVSSAVKMKLSMRCCAASTISLRRSYALLPAEPVTSVMRGCCEPNRSSTKSSSAVTEA